MQAWSTPEPLVLPIDFGSVARLDLEFVNMRRDAGSFTAYVFVDDVNSEAAVPADAGRDYETYAGAFNVFAPTVCWGVDDHCDWSKGPVSPFDRRPPHHLTPINVSMDVTDAVKRLGNPDALTVTVHAALRADREASENVVRFESLSALAYK